MTPELRSDLYATVDAFAPAALLIALVLGLVLLP